MKHITQKHVRPRLVLAAGLAAALSLALFALPRSGAAAQTAQTGSC